MRWRRIEVVIVFLDVFAVVAFVAGETEKALLENGVFAIPKGQREADVLMPVADAADAVFAPAIGAAARVVMGQIFPGRAVGAVIFADRAPLALGQIGSPALPVGFADSVLLKSKLFLRHGLFCSVWGTSIAHYITS